MQRFRGIILPMQGHGKNSLHWLYNTREGDDDALPLVFSYNELQFWFSGTGFRNSEKLLLYISIPAAPLSGGKIDHALPYESYLLEAISPAIADLSEEYQNTNKNIRERAQFASQEVHGIMVGRNGIHYEEGKDVFVLRLHFNVPLVNAVSVNAKAAVRAIKDILRNVEERLKNIDAARLLEYKKTYRAQQDIRRFMKENGLCVFVANGSILPREQGTDLPKKKAVPFCSPRELEVEILLSDGRKLCGMGIRRGVTVITGGGYSGKSTLLDAIELGIYHHIPGDGREYVLTEESALKIYAEDGRPVSNVDLSPFFRYLPGDEDLKNFSTSHASGSVSQASGIIEAVYGGSKLLLMDEDKSATNFMIRDKNMRMVVRQEPIIPFTDRVLDLYQGKGVSTILVIGGSSEYFAQADTVILMEDYYARDITSEICRLGLKGNGQELARREDIRLESGNGWEELPRNDGLGEAEAIWQSTRRLAPQETDQPFLFFRSIAVENEKKIILDDYCADVTFLTALISEEQLNMLAHVMERLLVDKEADCGELLEKVKAYSRLMQKEEGTLAVLETVQRFYEEIRPLDALCCINRMAGVRFYAAARDGNAEE